MKVSIAGAGAIAMGYAAFLQQRGHEVTVWSPSGQRTKALAEGAPLKVTGAITGEFRPNVCRDAKELAESDVIVLALPAYGHRFVLDSVIPHLEQRHTVIISAHLSFSALYLSKKMAERGIVIPVIVWNTTVLTSKAQSPTEIKVGAIRNKVDISTVPASLASPSQKTCVELFGDRFVVKDDILTIVLSNINPESHLATALCNLTRIERGEPWGQRTNVTPTVGRLVEALDRERLMIAEAFGKPVPSILDHFSKSFGLAAGSVAEISAILVERGNDPMGPKDIDTRYVLEDVPFGLIPALKLAEMANVDAPLHKSGVEILSACYGRNFIDDNDLLGELDLRDAEAMQDLIVKGYEPLTHTSGREP
ncbi:NAD/NADP octopine/nopaline dehydrogenase family protein (plasmid) [Agrobacterium rosae]|uniref:2-dehydropantoate 2-reductase n=1 Tax=Agrobacterium rosae TaxID=1972867 RepID=A0AAW9FJB8_9HYPH|nr:MULTISPECIES: NAD/NADP octopine/nopaline dehydrogenase family protein [Agrobacterium]MDX8321438.1 NAD/NADP octopine/nopaline dehydrogenase family protein [Agrobacterium sp. rho-8.1]MDX8305509.1 NAD/NADP octopine/nopaline dehydrogenase family protein [Agrobacterium rosae]MDX8310981.1 NAD/NADP octopine/nopaline dehydrogenase family protein [Agrobacterium sp. rho-13.3]MDX8316884.1 NAD/NADP octopine/nopaline dehydrogenase family protein [Agrobacterium rosae]MDX8327245.1 NAD/NADP octopine/nopali